MLNNIIPGHLCFVYKQIKVNRFFLVMGHRNKFGGYVVVFVA